MRRIPGIAAGLAVLFGMSMYAGQLRAQSAADREAVRRAALDYLEGFYEGDTAKLVRSVRPEVYKYGFYRPRDSTAYTGDQMTWAGFLEFARNVKANNRQAPASAPKTVELYDVLDQTASAKVTAWWGMDYLLLAKYDGRWMITHVLWQSPPAHQTGGGACNTTPEVFAPGIVSLPEAEEDFVAFSPSGDTVVFTRYAAARERGALFMSIRGAAGWSRPTRLPFSGTYDDTRTTFSPDGKLLLFTSNRPRTASAAPSDQLGIWRVTVESRRWGSPEPLPGALSTEPGGASHPSLARDGTLYFVRRGDVFTATQGATGWSTARPLDAVNSAIADSHVYVDPNQRFLLFARLDESRETGGTGDDIYLSVRTATGWSQPEALAAVNTEHYEYSAKVSPDGTRLFYTSNGRWTNQRPADIVSVPLCAVPALARVVRR